MNKTAKLLMLILMVLIGNMSASADDTDLEAIPAPLKNEVVDSISAKYYDWKEVSMSGKLSTPMLPISASVKIYMEKDRLIVISVSAPLIGEAARIEIDPDQALVVNKLKNTYTTIETERIETICPGGLTAVQNLLLGRINIMGSGELSSSNSDQVEIYGNNPGLWTILPNQDLENAEYVYFYTVSTGSLLLDRFIVLSQDETGRVDCNYAWGNKDYTLNFEAVFHGRSLVASLKLNNPDSNPKKISRIDLKSKYKEVDIYGILRM